MAASKLKNLKVVLCVCQKSSCWRGRFQNEAGFIRSKRRGACYLEIASSQSSARISVPGTEDDACARGRIASYRGAVRMKAKPGRELVLPDRTIAVQTLPWASPAPADSRSKGSLREGIGPCQICCDLGTVWLDEGVMFSDCCPSSTREEEADRAVEGGCKAGPGTFTVLHN